MYANIAQIPQEQCRAQRGFAYAIFPNRITVCPPRQRLFYACGVPIAKAAGDGISTGPVGVLGPLVAYCFEGGATNKLGSEYVEKIVSPRPAQRMGPGGVDAVVLQRPVSIVEPELLEVGAIGSKFPGRTEGKPAL